jgi:hypothetical protein
MRTSRGRNRRIDHFFERALELYLLCALLFLSALWLSERRLFTIDTIDVHGAVSANAATIRQLGESALSEKFLWKIRRDNAVLFPRSKLRETIMSSDAHIKDVIVRVISRHTLLITVVEYESKNIWCAGVGEDDKMGSTTPSLCFFADDTGYIFSSAPEYSGSPFIIYRTHLSGSLGSTTPVGALLLPSDEFLRVRGFLHALEGVGILGKIVDERDAHDYRITSNKEWDILWSSQLDPVKSVENLTLVTRELGRTRKGTTSVESIDLRFGNKIFYR